jgi:hypothetical protein
MHVLVCDPISPRGIEFFKARPEFRVTVLPKRLPESELIPLMADVEAMVVRSETKPSMFLNRLMMMASQRFL